MNMLRAEFDRLMVRTESQRCWIWARSADIIYSGFFILLAYMTTKSIWSIIMRTHSYMTTDWGISYAGGFVRRGLIGDVILHLSRASGLSFAEVTAVIAVVANLLFVLGAALLFARLRHNHWAWLLIYTPAGLAFGATNPGILGHKDVLLLALGAMLFSGATLLPEGWKRTTWVLCGLALTIPLVLSHEGLVIFVPILFIALSALRLTPPVIGVTALIVLGLGAAVLASVMHSGTIAQRDAMIEAFYAALPPQWSLDSLDEYVAFWFVGQSVTDTFAFVATRNYIALWELPFAVALAFGPIAVAACGLHISRAFSDPKGRISAHLIVLSYVSLIALMPLVIDWMRFFIVLGILTAMAMAMRLRLSCGDRVETLPGAVATPENAAFRYMLGWVLLAALFVLTPGKVSPWLVHFGWNDILTVVLVGIASGCWPVLARKRRQ
ncbi:hypothetical protein D2T29_07420 [Sinirhodobacter populi]|uniref:Uncharacterized protein n=1 Tax=Paenirhodobacter populi TaxID=2306993 RepID=A0A443KK90_9RHOB|nr:hypothetical protein [Sinirhodobacter populi]RWR33177.1 hypothetical protein D2T29_07420 [Sinirhodobacter populi]